MTRVLLTGASGRMAAAIRPRLREMFDEVVLFARSPMDDPGANERSIAGDLADRDAVVRAANGVDVVVHLGGKADEAPFEEIAQANITGTYNVFEASRSAGVRRVVYASSHHVTGFHSVETMVDETSPVRPDTIYGVSKVFGEALGRLYTDKWGLEVVCLRIGVCRERPENSDQLRTWLSVPDSISLVEAAISADLPERFWVVYGVSNNSRRFWRDGSARALGFSPQDKADDFSEEFDAKASYSSNNQGGRFTNAEYAGGTW
ncbi:NAD(P)-dependent oxidoreductase [Leifsonia bigeumensis]|uniref:NAD(P)-dependent oxidoreductase n=1 Tax=Leifsonella bigeumensis TaxID=433643 RepID=A0ABP7FHR8_9MICO